MKIWIRPRNHAVQGVYDKRIASYNRVSNMLFIYTSQESFFKNCCGIYFQDIPILSTYNVVFEHTFSENHIEL